MVGENGLQACRRYVGGSVEGFVEGFVEGSAEVFGTDSGEDSVETGKRFSVKESVEGFE